MQLFFLLLFLLPSIAFGKQPLQCGIDRLDASQFRELAGLRVGLITNAAALTQRGEQNYKAMQRCGVNLRFLMAPEHGLAANVEAGKKVGHSVSADSLPVYSLYGATRKPEQRHLHDIDLLLFDLQDVGVRCYTYISTMKLAMEACAEAGIPFMVLDRPNPIAPLQPQGFMLQAGYESFVGLVSVPFVHGMSVGEIALLLQRAHYPNLDVRIITMTGYQPHCFGDELEGFTFRSPSPNIRDVATALLYPATVLLEATTVSEGRGTQAPFQQFGAPFIKSNELLQALERYHLAGVKLRAVRFTPTASKWKGEECKGIGITVTNRRSFSPFAMSVALLRELQRLYPAQLGLDIKRNATFFDRLAGTPRLRELIVQQASLQDILAESEREVARFRAVRLYR
uniref:DUF1343 domain-containing protein n=1 Tax=Chlorobium chlorochromatii (strain CaD3) TaxID=340177 RepID=Q3AQS1_CHLCH